MKKIIFAVGLFLSISLFAQSEERFRFEEETHDFGVVEEGGDAIWKFKFRNVGKDTILLKADNVKPGCGCTTRSYTTTAVLPGDTGSITSSFGTTGRVGTAIKNISVNYKGSSKILMFKVVVIPKDTSKYSEAQKKKAPSFWSEKTAHDFGKVQRGQKVQTSFQIKNNGKDSLRIESAVSACGCITYKFLTQNKDKSFKEIKALGAGKSAIIEVTYTANHNGKGSDIITFTTNDVKARRKAFKLTAELVEAK
jgi:hypothetical protein